MGPKRVYLMDEPTTGLDSSTAYQVVRSIADYAHLEQARPLTHHPASSHMTTGDMPMCHAPGLPACLWTDLVTGTQ